VVSNDDATHKSMHKENVSVAEAAHDHW
jgi:hypothetical protein